MARIFVIKHETDVGPFFSSKAKARAYLEHPNHKINSDGWTPDDAMEGNDPYVNVLEIELDDERVCFDS